MTAKNSIGSNIQYLCKFAQKLVELARRQYQEKSNWWIWIFLAQIPLVTSNEHNPSSGYLGKIHFFDILMMDFGLSSFKNPYLRR